MLFSIDSDCYRLSRNVGIKLNDKDTNLGVASRSQVRAGSIADFPNPLSRR